MDDTLKKFYSNITENSKRQMDHADKYLGLAESDALQRKKWMQMLMNEYNNKQSTNPFIALLDGYIGMRQNDNPDYQWKGLLGSAKELFQKRSKDYDLGDGVSYDPFSPLQQLNLRKYPLSPHQQLKLPPQPNKSPLSPLHRLNLQLENKGGWHG